MSEVVQDTVAEKLEVSGLWRRAKARWLEVMQSPELTEPQRLWIRQRRKHCQAQIAPVPVPERLDIAAINKAANDTQARMGIAQPNGVMFRAFPEGKNAKK
jgi:hypothetical protein